MKSPSPKNKKLLLTAVEDKYGVVLKYTSDKELHETLVKDGVPSLSRLLKRIHST